MQYAEGDRYPRYPFSGATILRIITNCALKSAGFDGRLPHVARRLASCVERGRRNRLSAVRMDMAMLHLHTGGPHGCRRCMLPFDSRRHLKITI